MADISQISSQSDSRFCKQNCIVYLIKCTDCDSTYVGQTSNDFNVRINVHRSSIKNYREEKDNHDYELLHFQFHAFEKAKLLIIHDETAL